MAIFMLSTVFPFEKSNTSVLCTILRITFIVFIAVQSKEEDLCIFFSDKHIDHTHLFDMIDPQDKADKDIAQYFHLLLSHSIALHIMDPYYI